MQSVRRSAVVCGLLLSVLSAARAEPPHVSYVFPAGAQRGTKVAVRIGGHYLHDRAPFRLHGPGVAAPTEIVRGPTVWFEGPLIHQPASQQREDYAQDYAATIEVAADAPLGDRLWHVWNAQGVTAARRFVVGDLPEVIEQEIDGEVIPVRVSLPVTVNGRIFPREDIDAWTFTARAGQPITCAVAATTIGSPLDARLEVRGPTGTLAEATAAPGRDPMLHFLPPADGEYEVHIQDVRADGHQHFVYRLTLTDGPWIDSVFPLGGRRGQPTAVEFLGVVYRPAEGAGSQPGQRSATTGAVNDVSGSATLEPTTGDARIEATRFRVGDRWTNEVPFDFDVLPELREPAPSQPVALPVVLNGRIDRPGAVDVWPFTAVKGDKISVQTLASRLGSPLQAVVAVRDAEGRELLRGDAVANGGVDPTLAWTCPADGTYAVAVAERFASRGGPAFAYRVKLSVPSPQVRLELAADAVSVDRGAKQKLVVNVARDGWSGPVRLVVEGLEADAGVTAAEVTVAANQNRGEVVFDADKSARVRARRVRVLGRFEVDGQPREVPATFPGRPGQPSFDGVLLATTWPTPFKFVSEFQFAYVPVGSVYRKRFVLERNGFAGPFEVRLADRQSRHLQGVTGPTIQVPAEADEFVYPVTLPPWMELGRTSRAVLMVTGEVTDEQGDKHKVCYTTADQSCQLVNLVSPSPFRVTLDKSSLRIVAGTETRLPVQIRRTAAAVAPVRIELIVPPHVGDVAATPLELNAEQSSGELTIRCGAKPGPFNLPLTVRATTLRDGSPLVAEANVELVPAD